MRNIWKNCLGRNIKKPFEGELLEDMVLEQWTFPKGTKFKAFEGKAFGYIVIDEKAKDKAGNIPAKRIFRH